MADILAEVSEILLRFIVGSQIISIRKFQHDDGSGVTAAKSATCAVWLSQRRHREVTDSQIAAKRVFEE